LDQGFFFYVVKS